jgi:hypothetical protein
MKAVQYFSPTPSLEKESQNNDENTRNKETSRELTPVQTNTANVLQLKDNGEISNDNQVGIQNNNFIIPDDVKETNVIYLHNTNNVEKTEKIISLLDYDALSPQDLLKYDNRTNSTFLKDTLTTEHSLLSLLFQKSLKNPAFIRLLQLVFSLSIQFAFNALLITDDDIDQRTNNPNKVILN